MSEQTTEAPAYGAQWDALAREASPGGDEDGAPEMLRELLTCVLAGSAYAIPVERVREIVRMRAITPMPRTPDWVLGVISLRGEVVQVVDLRMRLQLECAAPTRTTRIVVLHGEDGRVAGFLVDSVREVLRVGSDVVRPSTAADLRAVEEICLNGDEFVSILDIEAVLESHAGR